MNPRIHCQRMGKGQGKQQTRWTCPRYTACRYAIVTMKPPNIISIWQLKYY
jgi:hypothetical protein